MDQARDLAGIVFVVSTMILGILVLAFARRRGIGGLETRPNVYDTDCYLDPIVQADVYLARGWRAHARAILEESLRVNPGRADVRAKLATID